MSRVLSLVLTGAVGLLLGAGCLNQEVEVVQEAQVANIYEVQAGDSLWSIAKVQLGTGMRYREICELNQLGDNHILRVGQKLGLPEK